jgi:hypothetical protein
MASLRAFDIENLLDSPSWDELRTLSLLLGRDKEKTTALGYNAGPDPRHPSFAFLAGANGDERCSFVVVKLDAVRTALLTFAIIPRAGAEFAFEGFADPAARGSRLTAALPSRRLFMSADILLPAGFEFAPGRVAMSQKGPAVQSLFLVAMRFSPRLENSPVRFINSVDLAGARIGEWVVFFHNETHSAREPQFFFVEGGASVRCLVTGLAPGAWELWHNGFVKEPSLEVTPRAGSLYFEGDAGDYFLRRYN